MRGRSIFDRLTLGAVLFLSVAITVLDFTGAVDNLPWLKERIPVMTLLVVGIVTLNIFVDGDRFVRLSRLVNKEAQAELVALLGADHIGTSVISKLDARFKEREIEIHSFFDEIMKLKRRDDLIEKLEAYQEAFKSGRLGSGSRTRFPWDMTIAAMDRTGTFIYHPKPDIQGTRPNQEHHSRILRELNGEHFWINQFITPQLSEALSVTSGSEFKHDRFTRVYYRYNRHLQCICIAESHLDVLYQLPGQT